jgi:hypothetical protein
MSIGTVDVPGLLYSAFFAPPFLMVSVVALRDLLFQVAANNAEAPCRKRVIQVVVASAVWLVAAVVGVPFALASRVAMSRIINWSTIFIFTPMMIAYAWATVPSAEEASRPIERSRVALLYDKFFGINGKVRGPQVWCSGLYCVIH